MTGLRSSTVREAAAAAVERITIIQGIQGVSASPDAVMTTVLGSCVAACLWDPTAGVGGMNHFLLPPPADGEVGGGMRYGVHAMELLLNAMFHAGARRAKLQARLFGGAKFADGWDVGRRNGEFAVDFLSREGIPLMGGSLGGRSARRVEFWPVSGRARQRAIAQDQVFTMETRRGPARRADEGVVQLF